MKQIFCKIIELEDFQVVAMKWFDEGVDNGETPYQVRVFLTEDGVYGELTFSYETEQGRDLAYNKFDNKMADRLVNGFRSQFNSKEDEEQK